MYINSIILQTFNHCLLLALPSLLPLDERLITTHQGASRNFLSISVSFYGQREYDSILLILGSYLADFFDVVVNIVARLVLL